MVTIEYNELLSYGIPENTLRIGCLRYRNGKSNNWVNRKDSKDSRKVLIEIDSIPETTRLKYNIPDSWQYFFQAQDKLHSEIEKAQEVQDTNHKYLLLEAYRAEYMQFVPLYLERYAYKPKEQKQRAHETAKIHAFWLKMHEITTEDGHLIYGMAFKAYQYYKEIKEQVNLGCAIQNERYFKRRLKNIREAIANNEDLVSVIAPNSRAPRNPYKTNDFHRALALEILSHPKMYAYRVATDLINQHCTNENQPLITESWLKALMVRDLKFRSTVEKSRYGRKHFKDTLLPHAVRNITPFPGNVWMIDGTPIQFFCWNESRTKSVRLNLFAIIDVCSRKIVGFDIAYNEDRFNVMNAIKMAVLSEGHLPAEIVSDNFSANKTDELKHVQNQMEQMGVIWRFSEVENPQDKAYIERFFGTFQSIESALYDDYLGEGITSKRKNARPNPKYLAEVAKKKGLPTYKEMLARISKMIAKHNERTKENQKSPNEIYKTGAPNAKPMDVVNTALMFWKKTTHTVKRGMVKITVQKQKYSYEILEHDLKMMYQGKTVTVRYDETDLDTVMLFDEFDQPICECRQSLTINIGAVDRTEKDELNTMKIVAKNNSYEKHINDYKADIIDKGLQVVGKEHLDIVHPLSLEKNQVNSQESKHLMELYNRLNNISPDEIEKQEFEPIATITRKGVVKDVREKLLEKKGTKKGLQKEALEVVQQ